MLTTMPRPFLSPERSRRLRNAGLLTLLVIGLTLNACARRYSVSLNEQVLYDPRPGSGVVVVADAGLQSCINVSMRQREQSRAGDVEIIACPELEIESLAGIQQLNNLRYLDLANNQLVHMDELRGLSRLSSVNAPNNNLTDISGLLSIASLTSAVLTGNNAIPCEQLDTLEQRLRQNLLRPERCVE